MPNCLRVKTIWPIERFVNDALMDIYSVLNKPGRIDYEKNDAHL